MNVRVLGCHGGELKGHRTTCFLIDGKLTIDGGSMCEALDLKGLLQIDDILLTHSHWDHVKDVPLLTDYLVGERKTPVTIHGPPETMKAMASDVFNNRTWPDFREIPTKEKPVLSMKTIEIYQHFEIQGFRIRAVPVKHPVQSVGYILEKNGTAIAFSGDTGPTEELWRYINGAKNVKAVFCELSFPNKLQWLADLSGHYTPKSLMVDLKKLDRRGAKVYLYHMKPAFMSELRSEVAALKQDWLHICELDESYSF
jgi:ribonuclease BN (tRNA processing enzyme)